MANTGNRFSAFVMLMLLASFVHASSDDLGSVTTTYRAFSPSDTINVISFNDPNINGITCYLSRAVTGGMASIVGVAEDSADASIACVRQAKLDVPDSVRKVNSDGVKVFKQSTSVLFKSMQVIRFYDAKRRSVVYMVYSDRLIEGSPNNSIAAISID